MNTRARVLRMTIAAIAAVISFTVTPSSAEAESSSDPHRCTPATGNAVANWEEMHGQVATVAFEAGVASHHAERARRSLDEAAALFDSVFAVEPRNPIAICLVAADAPLAPSFRTEAGPRMAGAAVTNLGAAVVSAAVPSELERVTLHEAAHLLAAERARANGERALPDWMTEGLAETAAAEATGRTVTLHQAALVLRSRSQLPSLRQLQTGLPNAHALNEVEGFYVASASAIGTLVEQNGWDAVWEMLKVTGKLPARLESTWNGRLDALEELGHRSS